MSAPACSFCGASDVLMWQPAGSAAMICRPCAEAAAAAIAASAPRAASHSDVAQLIKAISELRQEMQSARLAAVMAAPPILAPATRPTAG